ncbi:hypothetical protein BKA65DRAFT_485759 [Rhexocercosporidium sp. MPI-PUGE-AT-0058]|nr:hypothetical protein BKA65DRAFT_485759 [Rhexocercosporidium sp. MPI-PUGE-AT-0058]
MSPIKSMPLSETANHSVLPEPYQLSRGMYTCESIASMTPAHTSIESKVKAPSNSVAGMGLISHPSAPRRSTRLAQASPTNVNLDSPSCPPSLRAAKTHRMITRATASKVVISSRVSKSTSPVKKLLPTAAVSKVAVKRYHEIMKVFPPPAPLPKSTPSVKAVGSPTQVVIATQIAVSTQATTTVQSPPLNEISFNNLAVRTKGSASQEG